MLFGPTRSLKFLSIFLIFTLIYACKSERSTYSSFLSPEGGSSMRSGAGLTAKIDFSNADGIDSVVYLIDSIRVGSKKDTSAIMISTAGIQLGNHILLAKIFKAGEIEEVTTNLIIVNAEPPVEYGFKIKNTYPHDPKSYVQGLEYHDGIFYESAGQRAESNIRKVEVATGKVLQETRLADNYFAEGLTVIGDRVIQITYTEKIGFVYDKATLKKTGEFQYSHAPEGWGLAFDGETVYNSSGQSTIYLLDKDKYTVKGSFEVYDHNGPVDSINELEWIDGRIYANVYKMDGPYANKILVIDPKTGGVESTINLIGLHPQPENAGNSDYILNGIAWDKTKKRLFVTGKYWPKLFEIEKTLN